MKDKHKKIVIAQTESMIMVIPYVKIVTGHAQLVILMDVALVLETEN